MVGFLGDLSILYAEGVVVFGAFAGRNLDAVTDFNGFVSMVGDANKNINLISDALEGGGRCRIKIGSCDVSNRYDKEAGREYTNFAMFDFEMADGSKDSGKSAGKPAKKKQQKSKPASPLADEESDDDDENLPF